MSEPTALIQMKVFGITDLSLLVVMRLCLSRHSISASIVHHLYLHVVFLLLLLCGSYSSLCRRPLFSHYYFASVLCRSGFCSAFSQYLSVCPLSLWLLPYPHICVFMCLYPHISLYPIVTWFLYRTESDGVWTSSDLWIIETIIINTTRRIK